MGPDLPELGHGGRLQWGPVPGGLHPLTAQPDGRLHLETRWRPDRPGHWHTPGMERHRRTGDRTQHHPLRRAPVRELRLGSTPAPQPRRPHDHGLHEAERGALRRPWRGPCRTLPACGRVPVHGAHTCPLLVRLRPLSHLPEHPRQNDRPTTDWGWGGVFLARRGDAFVRALFERATTPAQTAFAFGALASYGGNAIGSAYLGHVVGGPRCTHRYRDRLARNTVGTRCAHSYSLPAHAVLAATLPATLPTDLSQYLTQVLDAVYDTERRPPIPDLSLGMTRMVRQLELYETICRPPLPSPPAAPLAAQTAATPAGGAPSPEMSKLMPLTDLLADALDLVLSSLKRRVRSPRARMIRSAPPSFRPEPWSDRRRSVSPAKAGQQDQELCSVRVAGSDRPAAPVSTLPAKRRRNCGDPDAVTVTSYQRFVFRSETL